MTKTLYYVLLFYETYNTMMIEGEKKPDKSLMYNIW